MSKEMVISANPHETRVAIMEEGLLCEYYVEREKEFALVGSIYKGRVTRVLPGMQSSFVDIGLDSDAFLYVTDFLEGLEDLDDHVATQAAPAASAPRPAEAGAPPFDADAAPDRTAFPSPGADDGEFPAVTHAAHDGPLSEAATAARYPAPPVSANPVHSTSHASGGSAPSRGRFDNRNRPGRDFGTRGGRRGGRFNKRSGGRGGDQRYGRELPSSKYASPRSYDEQPGEAGTPEGHVSIILPGESLAKYKDKPPASDVAPIRPPDETMNAASAIPAVAQHSEQSSEPDAVRSPEFRPEHRENTRTDYPKSSSSFASSSTGIEPLPGETLSKWKPREPAAEMSFEESPVVSQAESIAPPNESLTEEQIDERQGLREQEIHHAENWHEDQPATELTEDEATALAEHVAEAQDEEAAREVQDRVFAEADAAEAAQHAAEHGELPAYEQPEDESEQSEHALETSAEVHELEEEEENAEGEGMIAPPVEPGNELDHHLAIEPEAIAAADSEVPSGNVDPGSQQQQQPWKARVRDDFRARMQNPARRGGRDRGGRRDDRNRRPQRGPGGSGGHSHQRSQQVRRPQLIADMLKQGQEIIVQIAKEPLGKKGARITSHVALPGRFLVYMPTLDHTGVSRKIASAEERARLRHLVNDAKGTSGGGFIVRTAAGSAAPEEVRADVEFLTRTWSEIKARSEQRKAPSVLHRDLNLVERMLRDHMNSDYTAIWVDSEEEYTKVVDFMSRFQPTLVNRVKLYTKDTPVFEEFGIQQEIDKGLKPKVWLKSGGYIVINHTEALVAIDVNTGKFVGKGSNRLEDTIVRTNVEAVKEIVRQMRLRDLGGIIVIDFIDMEERRNREKVMAALEDALKADRAPSKVLRFNEFGLVAITRKRTKQALERTLCQPCPYCTGSGMVKSVATLCYEIQTEARKMAPEMDLGSITLRVHPEIAKALKTRESSLIEELERWTKKSVIIQADPTLHWEQYDIY